MALGQNILELRKKNGLSQEQLGEKVNVTRQTISNWELEETTPNPEQLKLLSKVLNVSIDDLLDNDIQNVVLSNVKITQKQTKKIKKILKIIVIGFIALLIIDIISFIIFVSTKGLPKEDNIKNIEIACSMNNNDYLISVGSDAYFNCSNCPNSMQKEIKNICVDFNDLKTTEKNISRYFTSRNGSCN